MNETLEELCPYADVCDVEYGSNDICKNDYTECGLYQFFTVTRDLSGIRIYTLKGGAEKDDN